MANSSIHDDSKYRSRLARFSSISDYAILILVILGILLAILNSLRNPLLEPPDELIHYQFVRYLVDARRLPVQPSTAQPTQYHQPPLYYMLGALMTSGMKDENNIPPVNDHWTSYKWDQVHRDNKRQYLPMADVPPLFMAASDSAAAGTARVMYVLRSLSVLLLACTLILSWMLARLLWPKEPHKQLLLVAVVALNPMFIYIGGSINNDNLVIFFGALLLYLSVRALRNDFSWVTTALIGVTWGCAILSKPSGLILAATWGTALLWQSWRKRNSRFFLSRAAVIVGICLVISSWWFIRNWQLYGEPLGTERMLEIWGRRRAGAFNWPTFIGSVRHSWMSFWGRFGYGQVVLPTAYYWFYTALTAVALIGLLWRLREEARSASFKLSPVWLVAAMTTLAYLLGLFYFFSRNPTGSNGRYVFPALPAIGMFLALGLSTHKWSRQLAVLLPGVMAAMAIFSIAIFVPWTYARPPLQTEEIAMSQMANPQSLSWGEGIRLLGTTVAPRLLSDGPDSEVVVRACWRSESQLERNYVFFVHLLDPDLNPLGQRNTHPGLGNYPTSLWQPGAIFCEDYHVPINEGVLKESTIAAVEIGFYDSESRERLLGQYASGLESDFIIIDQIKLSPVSPAEQPEPAQRIEAARFAQGVSLLGYEWLQDTVMPGESVVLRLWWQASGPLNADFHVFAHLLDEDKQLIGQADGQPRGGTYPTSFWGKEVIVEERTFFIPPTALSGDTTVSLGLYRLEDGTRLSRSGDLEAADYVDLPGVTIR
jgi:4-amino-4-deoxy-L-arabinose transferase-like glycosyltransferase